MRRGSFHDRAVVVRTHDFGEADRVVVLLTRHHGVVRSVAKGVRKAKSRFGSRLQPFVHLDVQLYPGRKLATITQADTVAYYGSGIIEDWDRYTAASVVVEAAERLAMHGEEDPALFDAVINALSAMQTTRHPTATLDAFLLRALELAGLAPRLFECASCQAAGPHRAFHPEAGGAVCVRCRPSQSASVPAETLHLMWLLAGEHWAAAEQILDGPDGPHLMDTAHRLTVRHLQWHLDAKVGSLRVLEQR
ncbi:DNA repair protein RecO [Corynebacterium tapiri]|uniref:DNA repair protein RecO n=1 Tax=Corynebacterium tapiri TaxID=1448266 RepID=A0A5C4U293_9CORY|nr:DNA repair protein RecO [Corynebacterium tapiri]TNL96587.1 DNA repair protein RecO [Corynebacterium tapiri]